jgi:phosphomevalonate kinase
MPEASAPGKLLLSGEYAVLRGAPAVSVSVGVRAVARVTHTPGPAALNDATSGRSYPFDLRPETGLHWRADDPGERGRLPAAVFDTLAENPRLPRWPEAHVLQLDTDAFAADGSKYGLGSSAALTVALTAVAAETLGQPTDRAALAPIAARAHRRFQHGSGSGVDVLTALHGGLVCVYPGKDPLHAEATNWPDGLFMVIVWSGRSASTPELIAAFDRFAATAPAASLLDALARCADQAAAAWRSGDSAQIFAATARYAASLAAVDEAGGLGIVTDEHRRLAEMSASVGAIYKSSGAGGGDLGFALTDDESVAAELRRDFVEAGFEVLELETGVAGLELSR